jgi:tRNA threonylcarbamoyl adenosine modification protein (Sua5/YciO/YrdC/YwlC family)
MRRVPVHAETPNPRTIRQAGDVLRAGGLVIYPTDTVYGIGCDITNKDSVARLYRLMDLDPKKPLSFMCRDLKHIADFAWLSDWQYKTMRRMVPGPYTFILEASREVPRHMVARRREVGIRVPDHAVPQALLEDLGHPIITTSLGEDPETGLPFQDPERIGSELDRVADIFLDCGPGGVEPSTVLNLVGGEVEVVRAGAGSVEED